MQRAKTAADDLRDRESNSRAELGADLDDHISALRDAAKETSDAIKSLARLTKRAPVIAKPAAAVKKVAKKPTKAKAVKPVAMDDDDDSDDDDVEE